MRSLKETQQAIVSQSLNWEAGRTGVGELMSAGHFSGFGLKPAFKEPSGGRGKLGHQTFAFGGGNSLPTQVDWRNVNDSDWTSPIRDQAQCGSCVAFATCGVLESRAKIVRRDPHFELNLSEAHLFFCGGPTDGCEVGWQPGSALKFAREVGIAHERDFPYVPRQLTCSADQRALPPAVKVTRWRRLDGQGQGDAERKKAISGRGPVIGGMNVHSDFGWYKGGIYRPTTTEIVGRHAIAVIGYDDEKGFWIIKNSWGAGWGEGGWAKIGYGSCGIDGQFDFYDPEITVL
jgi:C1A family cysteine protease